MDNDTALYALGALAVLGLNLWIMHAIISSASRSKKIFDELDLQSLLLIEIARKLGVEESVIQEIAYEENETDESAE